MPKIVATYGAHAETEKAELFRLVFWYNDFKRGYATIDFWIPKKSINSRQEFKFKRSNGTIKEGAVLDVEKWVIDAAKGRLVVAQAFYKNDIAPCDTLEKFKILSDV